MALTLVETETMDRLFEEMANLRQSISILVQNRKPPGGQNEWDYYSLEEALKLLGISKKSWDKSYKNTKPKVIPYTKYGAKIWIKKTDLKNFIEKRRLT